jgi:carbonic anhydrase
VIRSTEPPTPGETVAMFDDLLDANARYATEFGLSQLRPQAAKQFALVTCIDSRIEPLAALGLVPGDAKILRNAGGRVTDDVLRSVAIAVAGLGVTRVAVMHHTDCAMATSDEALRAKLARSARGGLDGIELHTMADPDAALVADVELLRSSLLVPATLEVAGWSYDVTTGRITTVV